MSFVMGSAIVTLLVFALLIGVVFLITVGILGILKNKKASPAASMPLSPPPDHRLEELRRLVENSYLLQQEQKEGQAKLQAEVAQLQTKVNAMEKLLREVE